ncbi:MAG TPA: hypothetical protein VI503_02145 [Gaiellaceae bacterium]|nr:hypothetical protein [Gaiellaceae bacterium]
MEVAQALAELVELSSQVERAVVLEADASVLGSTVGDPTEADALAKAALELLDAAVALRSGHAEVTRAEVELAEGGLFVIREGGRTIAATTGPRPTAGLVAYDLRTCLDRVGEAEKPKRRRTARPAKESE